MATYTTAHPGNLAMEQQVWTLTLDEALRAIKSLGSPTVGSYWHTNLVSPYRRAVRKHAATVKIYTAGFSSGEFSNILYATGSTITA